MNTISAQDLSLAKRSANGGDYVTEGMTGMQPLLACALPRVV
jgi:hypothetical protein